MLIFHSSVKMSREQKMASSLSAQVDWRRQVTLRIDLGGVETVGKKLKETQRQWGKGLGRRGCPLYPTFIKLHTA